MANNFSSATLGLGVDTKDFNKNFNETYKTTEKVLASMKLSADAFTDTWQNLTAGIKDTKRIVSGILVSRGFYALLQGFTSASSAALEFSKSMETAAISMEYFVKGADKAAKAQAFLREMNTFAARTPFSTQEAISLSKYMQAVGVSMNTTKNFLKVITDTAAATGATEENLQRIVFGLGQMMTKGRIANEEIRQLANANIPIYEILQEQLGITGEQISNIGRYWVDADKAIVAILTGLENRYGGASDRIADTVTGMTDTIIDSSKIIAQIAFAGGYDALAEKMGTIRDLLDDYREIATEQGSMGLFDKLLRDMDASGELGTLVLSLIGNTRQLGMALKDLYIAGRPLISLFGKSLYSSIAVAEMTLTGMSKVVTGVIKGLEKFGLTSGKVAGSISSLFIAYKAAKWMAFLGQGATNAAYSLIQTVSAIGAVLPVSVKASAGVKLLTGSLIGLMTYGLAVWGIFKSINNTMAGLDASTTGENIFPDDYSKAIEEYQRKMDEYNEAIKKYQEDFNAPFTSIDDGTGKAVDDFEKIEDASSKASKAVKKHWLAAFDEVYSPPKDSDAGGLGGLGDLLDDMADLGKLLIPPMFSFPETAGGLALEMPDFPWSDIWQGSAWDQDNDVFKADWWKQLLPWVAIGAAQQIGKIFAKARGEDPTGTGKAGSIGGGSVNPFQDTKAAQAALNTMTGEFVKMEKTLGETLDALKAGKYKTPEEITAALKRLELQTAAALKLQEKISLQSIIAGSSETLKSVKLLEAQQYLLKESISNNAKAFKELTEAAKGLGYDGEKARIDLAAMRRTLEKQYSEYITLGGKSTDVDGIVDGIINTKGLGGKIDLINSQVANIRKALMQSNYDVLAIKDNIKAVAKTGSEVTKLLETIGSSDTILADNLRLLENIDGILSDQLKLNELIDSTKNIQHILDTFTVQKAIDDKINMNALKDELESLNKRIETLHNEIAVKRAVVSAGTTADIAAAKTAQELVNANIAFKQMVHTLETFLAETIEPLKAIERYNKRLILENIDGQRIVKAGLTYINSTLEKLPEKASKLLQPVFNKLAEAYKEALKTGNKPGLTSLDYSKELLETLNTLGTEYKANNQVIEEVIKRIDKTIASMDGRYPEIESILQKIEEAAAKQAKKVEQAPLGQSADLRSAVEAYQDKLEEIAETVKSIKAFDEKDAILRNALQTAATNAQKQTYALLLAESKRTGGPTPKLEDIPTFMETYKDAFNAAYIETRRELVARLKADKLQGSFLDEIKDLKTNSKMAYDTLKLMARDLRDVTVVTVGKGIRYSYALPQESMEAPFAKMIEKGYISRVLAESGIFDPFKAALKANEVAALSGQSGYGKTLFSVIADHLTTQGKLLANVANQLDTFRTIENKIIGQLAINPIMKVVNEQLKAFDLIVATGGKFYDTSRLLEASVNGLVYTSKMQFTAPVNTLTMANFESKLLPLLEKYGTFSDGIYALGTQGFKALTESMDDVAYELAAQAAVMGKNTVYLAVLDKRLAGLDKLDFGKLPTYNITDSKTADFVRSEIGAIAANYIVDHIDDVTKAVKLIAVQVPEDIVARTLNKAVGFKGTLDLIAANYKLGASLEKLLTPINGLGEKLGALTPERFAGSIYDAPTLGNAIANQLVTEVVAGLKSSNKAISEAAAVQMTDIIERMNKAIFQKGVHPAEIREVVLGATDRGLVANISMSGEQMLSKVEDLRRLLTNIDSYSSAITTSLHDLVDKYNTGANRGLRMDDFSGFTNAKGKQLTMNDLAYAIINQEKQITDMGNLSRQLSASLDKGANLVAVPITNYAQYADIGTYMTQLSGALSDQVRGAGGEQLKLGGNVYVYKTAEQLAAEFAKINWAGSSNGMFATRHDLFGGRLSYGRYAGYASEEAARAGQMPGTSGVYAQFGKAGRIQLDQTQLGNLGKALGYLGIAVSIGSMVKDTADTAKSFEELILPLLAEDQKASAQERANKMGITGWTGGANAGALAENFITQYAEMTEAERMFWGQVTATKAKPDFNMFGKTDLGVLEAVLNGMNVDKVPGLFGTKTSQTTAGSVMSDAFTVGNMSMPIYPGTDLVTGTPEEVLAAAMADGIEKSSLARLVDYIVMSGDTESDVAKAFYKKYGSYVDTIVKPAYGVNQDWLGAVSAILNSGNQEVKDFIIRNNLSGLTADQVPLNMKGTFDQIIQASQDSIESMLLPVLQAQEQYNSVASNPLAGDYARAIVGADFSGISDDAIKQLGEVLGITLQNVAGGGVIGIDSETIADNIMGWVTRLPDTISLDGASLSAQDVAILASAGIQINGDGTVTFMKAMNENVTGTSRTVGLTLDDLSTSVLKELAENGISIGKGVGTDDNLDLSVDVLSEKMTSAMFRLNKDLSGQVSSDMQAALDGLGKILDSGYFEITNKAVLSGEMTIQEYISSMGDKADELSPEVLKALLAVDDAISQGGEATRKTVAEWADGISMPSPIDATALTPEIEAAFAAVGITFTQSGEEFLMVVNRLGNHIKDGMVLIPAETWNKVNEDVVEALRLLGVKTSEEAGFVMVDISGAMESGVGSIIELFANRPDLWNQIPQQVIDQLAAAGIAVENGMISINTAALNGLVNLGTEWYGKWSTLPQDVINAMGAAGLQTENGLLKIEQLTEDTAIPANVAEYIIKPFDELPAELQDRLTGGDESVAATLKGSEVLITGATEDAFVGAVNAVKTNFATMNEDADEGAKQLAETISAALASASSLNNIKIRQTWKPFEDKSTVQISGTPGNYTIRYGGVTYSNIAATSKTEAARLVEQRTGLDLPGYFYGGLIDKEGLYKAGEFGKQEAIIPLENKAGLSVIGKAISSTMKATSPVQVDQLRSARSLTNAGVVAQTASELAKSYQTFYMQQQNTQPVQQAETKPVIYVQHLIADKQGLRELEQKLAVVRLER